MLRYGLVATLLGAVTTAVSTLGSAEPLPTYVAARYRDALTTWFAAHVEYRVAVDADCACTEKLKAFRAGNSYAWPPDLNYHPYYILGDFRGDGAEDLAVGVISNAHPQEFQVLIVHGAVAGRSAVQDFLSEKFPLIGWGLHYGPPRAKPWRLTVGPNATVGILFEPTASGYTVIEPPTIMD
jgi:hypothetical protein